MRRIIVVGHLRIAKHLRESSTQLSVDEGQGYAQVILLCLHSNGRSMRDSKVSLPMHACTRHHQALRKCRACKYHGVLRILSQAL